MWLLGISLVVLALKYFEIGPVAQWSWWLVIGLFALTFVWFEFGERLFGVDKKRKAMDSLDNTRKERVEKSFMTARKKR